jgi:hypothetical protein
MATSAIDENANRRLSKPNGQLVTRRVEELRAHPSYIRHSVSVSASQLSSIAKRGAIAFRDPLAITGEGIVVDGYARWELARRQGRELLLCLEHELTEEESLEWLLQRHRRQMGLNSFLRILLALDLEPSLQEKARANQRAGGQKKGWSDLTKAQKVIVRSQIAAAAGTSAGSVTKVKQLLPSIQPELQEALRGGEVSIHRAWLWRTLRPTAQLEALTLYRSKKGVGKAIRDALSQHQSRSAAASLAPVNLANCLSKINASGLEPIRVIPIKMTGRTVFLTEELMEALKLQQQELTLDDRRTFETNLGKHPARLGQRPFPLRGPR